MQLSGYAALWVMYEPGLQKQSIWVALQSYDCLFSSLQNLVPTLPTMQFSHWAISLEAIYQITCSYKRPFKKNNKNKMFFHMQKYSQDL